MTQISCSAVMRALLASCLSNVNQSDPWLPGPYPKSKDLNHRKGETSFLSIGKNGTYAHLFLKPVCHQQPAHVAEAILIIATILQV